MHAAVRGVRAARASGFGSIVADHVPAAAAVAWTVGVLGLGAAVADRPVDPGRLDPGASGRRARRRASVQAARVRRLGGVTGDVFGALIESATAITLIGVALR